MASVHPVTHCSYAFSGTFGHECGDPATLVGVKKSTLLRSGVYFAGRCAKCAKIKGGENADILQFEPLNGQVNDFREVR